jgi:hypothetical protein
MKRKKTAAKKARNTSKVAAKAPAQRGNGDAKERPGHVIERPDGFYVQAASGEESGPYTTLAEAEAELLAAEAPEPDLEAGDLQEAESEIGVNEWIDPETGGPAEDSVPRIEDH